MISRAATLATSFLRLLSCKLMGAPFRMGGFPSLAGDRSQCLRIHRSETTLWGYGHIIILLLAFVEDTERKKADVVEHLGVFDHVGLLFNEPPGSAGVPFI